MKNCLKRIYKKCIYVGIQHSTSYQDSKRIILTNMLTFVYIILAIKYTFFFSWMKLYNFAFYVPLTVAFFGISIYLNKIGKQHIAGMLLITAVSVAVFVYSCIFGPNIGIQYIFFPLMITPSIVFSSTYNKFSILCIGIISTIFLSIEYLNYPFFFHEILSSLEYKIFRLSIILDSVIIISIIVYFHIQISNHLNLILHHFLKMNHLTTRESEITIKLIQGISTKNIALDLFIEESTVKTHLKNIYRKLNVSNRIELISLLTR